MSSSVPRRHRYFSPVSYIALPYLVYLLISGLLVDSLPEGLKWIRFVLALTWLPAGFPLAALVFGTGVPNTTVMVLQVVLVVGDVYFWAWLITKVSEIVVEVRRKEKELEERNPNVT